MQSVTGKKPMYFSVSLCFLINVLYFRCHTIFKENIKQTPVTQTEPVKAKPQLHAIISTEKQKKEIELAQKKHQISVEMLK